MHTDLISSIQYGIYVPHMHVGNTSQIITQVPFVQSSQYIDEYTRLELL